MKLSSRLRQLTWIPIAVFALLIGASEGGGGVTGTGTVAFGAVEDFGSVFVNGVEYFTDGATILIDGHPATEAQLRIGMRVRVDGVLFGAGSTGQANSVAYDPDLRGAVEAAVTVNAEGPFFTVDGIGVQADSTTITDGVIAAAALAAGDRVEVSGLRDDSSGVFRALRITRVDTAAGEIVSGTASGVTANSFNVGDLLVSFDGTVTGDATALADGMVVRVKSAGAPVGGVLLASEVRVLDGSIGAPVGTDVSAQGVVSGLTSTSFTLGGIRVTYDAQVRIRNGSLADLANGAEVEVEGLTAADGSVSAARITFPAPDNGAAQAKIVSISATGFTMISDTGVQVVVRADTKWRDRSAAKSATLDLGMLSVGDRVAVSGDEITEGVISADNVTRLDPAPGVVLSCRARAAVAGAIEMLGQHAVAGPRTTYQDVDGTILTADAFFAKAAGRHVKAFGRHSGSDILVSSFEIDP